MSSLESLPGDQRAVLQLVLGRGRSYGEIAGLLRIDPGAVRQRAVAALEAIGPETDADGPERPLVVDYLLGQLGPEETAAARAHLVDSAPDRAWARVLLSEIAPLATGQLPDIPRDAADLAAGAPAFAAPPEPEPTPAPDLPEPPAPAPTPEPPAPDPPEPPAPAPDPPEPEPEPATAAPASDRAPRSSRRGGAVVLGGLVIILAAIVVFVVKPGHHDNPRDGVPVSGAPTSTSTSSTTPTKPATPATTGTTKTLARINLTPTVAGSKAAAVAAVLQNGGQRELAIVGQGMPANTGHNAYEVWLYNSESDAYPVGFVNPGVTQTGRFEAATPKLPSNAGHYRELILTLETATKPTTPGLIVLQGRITGLS